MLKSKKRKKLRDVSSRHFTSRTIGDVFWENGSLRLRFMPYSNTSRRFDHMVTQSLAQEAFE